MAGLSREVRWEVGAHPTLQALRQFDRGGPVNIAQTNLVNERSLDSIETPHQSVQAYFTQWDPFERPCFGP